MEKQIWKPGTLLAPVPPVLVSCGSVETPNALTIGWTGIINTIPPMTYISVRPERFSHSIIKESGEFVINLPTKQLVRAVDFCGVRSGKTVNKFEHCNLTALPASQISAPIIGESPVSLECSVEQVISLGSHDMFIAKILCIDVDESIVDANGRLCLERAGLITYAHGTYYELGKALGTFGYTVQKKKKHKKKPQTKTISAKNKE